jgi:hypothetical protein
MIDNILSANHKKTNVMVRYKRYGGAEA